MSSSDQHKELTTRCQAWLRGRITGRGMQCGYEVPLGNGYVADFVALCGMQHRFMLNYLDGHPLERDGIVKILPEFACVFETKVSLSDFMATFGPHEYESQGRAIPRGSLHWIVVPSHLAATGSKMWDHKPETWGILTVSGAGLHESLRPKYHPLDGPPLWKIAYNILWYGKHYPG